MPKRTGLAAQLAAIKSVVVGAKESPISYMQRTFTRSGFVPSIIWRDHHIKTIWRALRRNPEATCAQWYALEQRLLRCSPGRSYDYFASPSDVIRGWMLDGRPMDNRAILTLSHDPGGDRQKAKLDRLNSEAYQSAGRHCIIGDYRHQCGVCGRSIGEEVGSRRKSYIFVGQAIGVCCDNKKCRALAHLMPRKSKNNTFLLYVIEEVTKHGGNNENFRRLARHFVRHA